MLATALEALISPTRPDPIPRHQTPASADSTEPDGGNPDGADPDGGNPDGVDPDGGDPDRGDPDGGEPAVVLRHPTEVLGEAFCQLIERFPTTRLPATAGGLVTVVVTIPLPLMLEGLGVATLSSGGYLTVGHARRLACQAGVIPAVLGTNSELLDLGRRTRLFTRAQRLAMTIRDHGCTATGCDRPATWCEGHHHTWWSHGGPTNLTNGRLLCTRHHTLIHHPDYTHTDADNGQITITKTRRRRT